MTKASEPSIMNIVGKDRAARRGAALFKTAECAPPSDEEAAEPKKTEASCWAVTDDTYFGVGATVKRLTPGCYMPGMSNHGPYLTRLPIKTDDLLVMPDDSSNFIIDDFVQFWSMKGKFTARGFLHKRGILMWGPPGSGKTSTIQLLIQRIVKDLKGIVLMVGHPGCCAENLKMIRKIEPNRPVICILEDLDSLVEHYNESAYLSLLDGEAQVDNIVFLATTNYPERLDPRFVDRPSRFDLIKWIDLPSDAARRFYLESKEPSLSKLELDEWVKATRGLTIPHLKEIIISVKCYGRTLDDTLARMRDMRKKKFRKGDGALGFATAVPKKDKIPAASVFEGDPQ